MPNAVIFDYDAIAPLSKSGAYLFVLPEATRDVFLSFSHRLRWRSSWVSDGAIDTDSLDALIAEMETCFMSGVSLADLITAVNGIQTSIDANGVILQEIADSLYADSGDSIVDVIGFLLPLLGTTNTELSSLVAAAQDQLLISDASVCCDDPNPTAKPLGSGQVTLYGYTCENIQDKTWTFVSGQGYHTQDEFALQITFPSFGDVWRHRLEGLQAGEYTYSWQGAAGDSGNDIISNMYHNTTVLHSDEASTFSFGGTVTLAEGDYLELSLQCDAADTMNVDGSLCVDNETVGLPTLAFSLQDNIGSLRYISDSSLMRTAQGWFYGADGLNHGLEVVPEIGRTDYDSFQLDWTRPISGTLQIDLLNASVVVDTVTANTSNVTRLYKALSVAWDEIKVVFKPLSGELVRDITMWFQPSGGGTSGGS